MLDGYVIVVSRITIIIIIIITMTMVVVHTADGF